MKKLYPARCPFCGHQPHRHVRITTRTIRHRGRNRTELAYRVSCSHCHARGPRRNLTATPECWELWERAREHALDDSWAEWARHVLTIAAADELGIDPMEALSEVGL